MDTGDDNWYYMVQNYLVNPMWIEEVDKKYGSGAGKFIGQVLKTYLRDRKPKINTLYEKLVEDLSRDCSSREIQSIVEEIDNEMKRSNEFYKIDNGERYFDYMSELYLQDSNYIKVTDKIMVMVHLSLLEKLLRFILIIIIAENLEVKNV